MIGTARVSRFVAFSIELYRTELSTKRLCAISKDTHTLCWEAHLSIGPNPSEAKESHDI